jgi:uncharacterized membrane protein
METPTRIWTKALTWQLLGLAVMGAVNYLYLGDWRSGLVLSLFLSATGLVMFYLHERLWGRVRWGRKDS